MYKDLQFPILIVHRDIKADTVAGDRVRGIARELEKDGFSIFSAVDYAEGRLVASTHHGLACMLIAAEGAGENKHLLQNMVDLIRLARVRAPLLPIFALGEQVTLENAPADAMSELNQLRGILYLFEDTVPFLARQVARARAATSTACCRPSSKPWYSTPPIPTIPGTPRGTAVAWPIARARWGRRSTSSLARTPCARTCRCRFRSWVRCWITPGRWRKPRLAPRAISAPITRFS